MKYSRREFVKLTSATIAGSIIGPKIFADSLIAGPKPGPNNPTMSLNEISNYLKNDLDWFKNKLKGYEL